MRVRRLLARMGWTLVASLAALAALHAVMFHMPGDPIRVLFGFRSPGPAVVAEIRESLGLDQPYPLQLARYLRGLLTGELGPIYGLGPGGVTRTGDVGELMWRTMPSSLRLVAAGTLLHLVVGTTLTVLGAASSPRRRAAATIGLCALVAVPSFVLAAMLAAWAPGLVASANLLAGAACLASSSAGITALAGRPVVVDARHSGAVRRALASGIGPGRLLWLHTLRPALGPVVTLVAAETGAMLAATVLVEPVLGRPGVGSLLVRAVSYHQGLIVVAIVGTFIIVVGVANLVADVLQSWLDPRVDAL